MSDVVAKGGRVLFVGTKRQASEAVADAAKSCAQYFVNHRWLGGTLTNWRTISNSIKRLKSLEELLQGDHHGLTKKELLQLTREKDKLERSLGGIKDMGAVPDLMFVIDTNKESIAIAEARKLHMPVVAVVDSNCDPEGISHPIPGNDDAGRAITLYCDLIARAAIDGIERAQGAVGIDLGAADAPIGEPGLEGDEEGRRAPQPDRRPRRKPVRSDARGPGRGGPWQEAGPQAKAALRSARSRAPGSNGLGAKHGDDHRIHGQGTAREDRRRHDGLQGSPRTRPRATWRPRSIGCAPRALPRLPRRPAASRLKG